MKEREAGRETKGQARASESKRTPIREKDARERERQEMKEQKQWLSQEKEREIIRIDRKRSEGGARVKG